VRSQATCVPSDFGSNEIAGSRYPGVIHVMFTLFCHVFGRFGKNESPKDLILRDGGLTNCVCHQDDLMLSSCLAYDLNPDLGRNTWSVSEKSASIFSRTSRDRAVGACCTEQGAATDRFSGPPINRVSRVGGDPIPFVFFLSFSSPLLSFVLQRSCDRRAHTPVHPTSTSGSC
jgi:hypothetical protein